MLKKSFKHNYLVISTIFIIITFLPYIISLLLTPTNMDFSGIVNGSLDHLGYIAKINSGSYFDTINYHVRTNYQTEIDGGYLFTIYSFFGLIFGNIGISGTIVFHIMKLVMNILFLFSFYLFLKSFVEEEKRTFVSTIVLFGGSLAQLFLYLIIPFSIFSGTPIVDLTLIPKDIFPMTINMYSPHFAAATSGILLSFVCANKYDTNKIKYSIINGLILFLIATIHPQVAVFTGVLEGIYILTEIKKRSYKIKDLLPISLWGLIPLPYLAYVLYIINTKFSLIPWIQNNVHPVSSESMFFYFVPVILFVIILFLANRKLLKNNKLLSIWLLSNVAYVFFPGNWQVKLSEGLAIPVLVFIALSLYNVKDKFKKVIAIVLILCNLPLVCDGLIPNRVDSLAYAPDYYQELYEDIEELEYPSVIFSNIYTSIFMLANTKHIFPLTSRDECAKFKEYYALYDNAVQTKDFSFIEKLDSSVQYYVYDKYYSEKLNVAEIESNLPYEKYKETENYIIYKIN